jgi:hypothetical protein
VADPRTPDDVARAVGEAAYDAVMESLERDVMAWQIEVEDMPTITEDGYLKFRESASLLTTRVADNVRDAVRKAVLTALRETA